MITAQNAAITLERVWMAAGFSGGGGRLIASEAIVDALEETLEDSRPSDFVDTVMTFLFVCLTCGGG